MIEAAAVIAIGFYTFVSANGNKIWLTVGVVLYIFGMIIGNMLENRLNDKIESLEKELKELKTNDQRNSL